MHHAHTCRLFTVEINYISKISLAIITNNTIFNTIRRREQHGEPI